MKGKYYYTPTLNQLLIALVKGIDVYEIDTRLLVKLDQQNIDESLYNFIKENSYEGHKINFHNYQIELPMEIMNKNLHHEELTNYLINRF